MKSKFEIGETVSALFTDGKTIVGSLMHIPSDTGDCFYINRFGNLIAINPNSSAFVFIETLVRESLYSR